MNSIMTLSDILLILVVIGFAYLLYTKNAELLERIHNLESMVKENEREGIVYGRYLAKLSDISQDEKH